MDSDRLYRFVTPGWALIGSVLLHYLILGGLLPTPDDKGYVGVIAVALGAFGSSPLLGLLSHVIAAWFMHCLRGKQQHFYIPGNRLEVIAWIDHLARHSANESIAERLREHKSVVLHGLNDVCDGVLRSIRDTPAERELWAESNRFYWKHVDESSRGFVVRGWTLYWSIVNSFFAYGLGFVIAVLVRAHSLSQQGFTFWQLEMDGWKAFAFVAVLTFFLIVVWYAESIIRPDVSELAYRHVISSRPATTSPTLRDYDSIGRGR